MIPFLLYLFVGALIAFCAGATLWSFMSFSAGDGPKWLGLGLVFLLAFVYLLWLYTVVTGELTPYLAYYSRGFLTWFVMGGIIIGVISRGLLLHRDDRL